MTMTQEYKLGCYVEQLNDTDYVKIVAALKLAGLSNEDIETALCSRVSDLESTIDVLSVLS